MKTENQVKKSISNRYRNWSTIVYPDSALVNWKDIIADFLVPSFISPLHDKDVNPDGEIKKAHYHVIFMFEGKKSFEQVNDMFLSFGGVGCQNVQSIRGYARYLCHLDNPEKFQYSQEDVVCLSGADFCGCIGLPIDKYKAIGEMIDYCKSNGIISYSELLEYCRDFRFDWFRVLCDNGTVVVREYLKSKSWTEFHK